MDPPILEKNLFEHLQTDLKTHQLWRSKSDPDKAALITQQLLLLLHAQRCSAILEKRKAMGQSKIQCPAPHCNKMKKVLVHMSSCKISKGCEEPHCSTSRTIISHWKGCINRECPVCQRLKRLPESNQTDLTDIASAFPEPSSNMISVASRPEKRPYPVISSSSQTNPKKIKTAFMSSLECPVCLEIPRVGAGPIFGCRNGHLICQNCVEKVKECPTCREKEIRCRNLFAERYIEQEMKDVPLKCKNVGCVAHLPMANDELVKHEKFCPHREVPCPAFSKNSCNWRGPLSNLIKHMKDKKCVQVIFDDNWKENTNATDLVATPPTFKSNLGDFPSSTESVFERSTVLTHWKPVVLLAKGILNVWCYVMVQRDSKGVWTFMTYSMLPKDCVDNIKAKITINSNNDTRQFTFECKVLSFETTKDEAIKMGHYMALHDSQVKPFKHDSKIFNYSVEIKADPKFLAEMNKNACVKETTSNATDTTEGSKVIKCENIRTIES